MKASHTRLVCPACKALVDVIEKTIADHGDCIMGGMRHVPAVAFKAGPGAPSIELLGVKPMQSLDCSSCGKRHPEGIAIAAKVTPGKAAYN